MTKNAAADMRGLLAFVGALTRMLISKGTLTANEVSEIADLAEELTADIAGADEVIGFLRNLTDHQA